MSALFKGLLLIAVTLLLCGCLGGKTEDVTKRDIEIARQLGAPDDVIESLKNGV